MALKNYTTQIDAHRTLGELQGILVGHGALQVMVEYDGKEPSALTFSIETPRGRASYRLPANVPAVLRVLQRQKNAGQVRGFVDRQQAARVAWRIIKDWTEAQLALLETEQASLDQIMLPYQLIDRQRTMYDALVAGDLPLMLPAAGETSA